MIGNSLQNQLKNTILNKSKRPLRFPDSTIGILIKVMRCCNSLPPHLEKYILFMLISGSSLAFYGQERTVTGMVISVEDSAALPAVTIQIKGTNRGVATDIDGRYSIEIENGDTHLIFRSIGFKSLERAIGLSNEISIELVPDIKQLQEIVITSFGLEREKNTIGYAVQTIESGDLVKSRTRSALQAMQGKTPGVQIFNASGALGASSNLIIRGYSSLTGENNPLYVLDGIPVNNVSNFANGFPDADAGNSINDLNPDDIESITILRGASAAALYGSRATNGVVLITTKSGKDLNGKVEVSFNSSLSFDRVLVLPTYQNQFGQGQAGDNYNFLEDQESWGDAFDGNLRPYGNIIGDPSSDFFNTQRVKPYVALEDNVREFFDIGKTWTNNIALRGGNAKSNFRLSFSDLRQSGVMPSTDLRRNTITANGSMHIHPKLDFNASINLINQENDLAINGGGWEAPYRKVLQTSRSMSLQEQKDLNNIHNGLDWYYTPFILNPYWQLQNDSYVKEINRFIGNFNVNYAPVDFLDLGARLGYDFISDNRTKIVEKRSYSSLSPNSSQEFPGFIREESFDDTQLDFNLTAKFHRQINHDLILQLLVGYNYNQRESRSLEASVDEISTPGFYNISNSSSTPQVIERKSKRRLIGVYSQLDAAYKDFLFAGVSIRNDWSSTLPADNNSFFYPSFNTSFLLSEVVELDRSIDLVRLRFGIAKVGNDAPVYSTNSTFLVPQGDNALATFVGNNILSFPFNGVSGLTEGDLIGNPNLSPEFTTEYELGADLNFFNDRLVLDFTYFDRTSEDQIVTALAPATSGFTSQIINAGVIRNNGIELLLKSSPVRNSNIEWDVLINFTRINNLVKELPNGDFVLDQGILGLSVIEGQPYGVFQNFQLFRTDEGNLIVDNNGLPQPDPELAQFGNVQPDWFGGITSILSYKGFTASITLDHKHGGKVYSLVPWDVYWNGTGIETGFNHRERFIIPNSVVDNGDGSYSPNRNIIRYSTNGIRSYWNILNETGEYLVIDGSFTKLRELSLSYQLPASILDRIQVQSIGLNIFGRNLWIHTPKENTFIDPEINAFTSDNLDVGRLGGQDFGGTPSTSTYGFEIQIIF